MPSLLKSAFCLALLAALLAGCGQKGPLYLPDQDPEKAEKSEG